MSKAKHTQGKWEVAKTARNENTAIWVGGTRIALVDEVPHEGSEANARLIAEAPTMYDLLVDIVATMERMEPEPKSSAGIHLKNAKELIKTIEG